MNFLHTSDLFIDAGSSLGALSGIVRLCNDNATDFLFICGNLFASAPSEALLAAVSEVFSELRDTQVVIIAGNRDYAQPGSAAEAFAFPEHVTFLAPGILDSVFFPDAGLEVHGLSYDKPIIREALLDTAQVPDDEHLHVLLACGGDARHLPFEPAGLAAAGWDYVALGGKREPAYFEAPFVAYSGSPESGCIAGTLPRENSDLLRLTVPGLEPAACAPAVDAPDASRSAYDLPQLRRQHPHDLITYYLDELCDGETLVRQKALSYGLDALLGQTQD